MKTPLPLRIVGCQFRIHGDLIRGLLHVGVPLEIRRDPDNKHDPNAMAVWVKAAHIPNAKKHKLDCADEWMLGHIAMDEQNKLTKRKFPISGTFETKQGWPRIIVDGLPLSDVQKRIGARQ